MVRRSLWQGRVNALALAAALSLAAPAEAPRLPRGVDVSLTDRALYALVTSGPTSAPRAAASAQQIQVAAVQPGAAPRAADGEAAVPGACALTRPGSAATATAACVTCHGDRAHRSHPVDVDYAPAWAASSGRLRHADEVVRRGLLLHEGKLHCVTCHEAASPWKSHLVVPPGSEIRPAVDPRQPATFSAPGVPWMARNTVPAGTDVARKALCTACHALD